MKFHEFSINLPLVDTYHPSIGDENFSRISQNHFQSLESSLFDQNFNEEAPPMPDYLMNIYHLNENERKKSDFWEKNSAESEMELEGA